MSMRWRHHCELLALRSLGDVQFDLIFVAARDSCQVCPQCLLQEVRRTTSSRLTQF